MNKKWNKETVKALAERKSAYSGKTADFFKSEGISSSLYYYLTKKHLNTTRPAVQSKQTSSNFIEFTPEVSSESFIEVNLKNGCCIKLHGKNSVNELQQVLAMVGAL